jgi:predicted NBD/HSP70 family sugar kinase
VSLASGTSKGLALDLIRARGPISRTELADVTGLTPATMSTLVRQLLSEGLVRETGHGESKGGRPMVLLEINPGSRFAVGVQLGTESITYIVINLGGGVTGRLNTPGVGSEDPSTMIERIAAQIASMLASLGIDQSLVVGIGVAAPGPVDLAAGAILGPSRMSAWKNVSVRTLLADATGLPVVFDNDATAAAAGDFWSGALGTSRSHATIYMGLGIGSGVLVDGTVFRGASSNAGELGQVPFVMASDGSRRVLEDLAGPWAVVREALSNPAEARRLGVQRTDGDEFGAFVTVAKAAVRGDAFAVGLLEQSARYLAAGAAVMANLFDLDSITLAGPAFAMAGSLYVPIIERDVNESFFSNSEHGINVRLSMHVSDAAAVGAAALVLQSELAPRKMGLSTVG